MSRVNRRKLKLADVQITIVVEPEEMQVTGHFISGDPDYAEQERKQEQAIIEASNAGNVEAWCCLVVKATWEGHEGTDSLGGCSFLSDGTIQPPRDQIAEMVDDHGMREQALEDLQRAVNSHDRRLLQDQILDTVQSLSDATLKNWVKRGFRTVEPIARLELKRRAIK